MASVKVISQETYDDTIKENIIEFSMSVEESREETIAQFEAQGDDQFIVMVSEC